MLRNFTKFKYNKSWNQSTRTRYSSYLPQSPQDPDDDLIMGILLAGLGTSYGWTLWSEKKDKKVKYMSDHKMLSSVVTGTSLLGSIVYIIKYIRR